MKRSNKKYEKTVILIFDDWDTSCRTISWNNQKELEEDAKYYFQRRIEKEWRVADSVYIWNSCENRKKREDEYYEKYHEILNSNIEDEEKKEYERLKNKFW